MVDGTGLKGISTLHFLNRVFPCKLSNAPFLFLISNVISALNLHQEVGGGKGALSRGVQYILKLKKSMMGRLWRRNESESFSEDAATRRKQRSKQLSAMIVDYIIHYKIHYISPKEK